MAIDLALSRAFLNASTELISGFGAPFLTAIPIGACASVTVLPPPSLATRTSLSTPGLAEITTSIASSAVTFSSILPAVAYSIESLWPDDFSKAGPSSCSTGRIAAAHSTFNSAAPAGPAAKPASSARAAARRRIMLFPTSSSPCGPSRLRAVQPVRPAATDMVRDRARPRQRQLGRIVGPAGGARHHRADLVAMKPARPGQFLRIDRDLLGK